MDLMIKAIMSGFSSLAFALYFNSNKRMLLPAFIEGLIGYLVFTLIYRGFQTEIGGTLIASLVIGIVGEFFSRYLKSPVTTFIIPGVIPLVPGSKIYYTMYYLVSNESYRAFLFGKDTLFIAGAISLGLLFASIFSKSLLMVRRREGISSYRP